VKIISGPFGGLAGIYQGMTTRDRELVLLRVLGGQRPVAIASAAIEEIEVQ
jgi:transcription antitermination factor NusG